MKITLDHEDSVFGIPVILDDKETVMTYADGIRLFREKFQMSRLQLAEACGVSRRTVEGWESGREPSARNLNVMAQILEGKL